VEPSLRRSDIKIRECDIPIHHYGKLNAGKVASKGEDYYFLGETKLKEKQTDLQSIIELATQAGELGKYEDAVELWKKVIKIKPDSAKAFLNIGGAFLALGEYEEALVESRKAMALDPNLKEAVLNYSYCEVFIGNVDKAIASLEDLLYKVPEYPPATAMLATAYFIQGKKEKGIRHLDKIKKMGFNSAEYLHERSKQFVSAGKVDYALLLLEIAVETDNVNRDVLSLLSECIKTDGTVMRNASIQLKNPETTLGSEIVH
jgi:tetratricopeptide (TPR) repeat protein